MGRCLLEAVLDIIGGGPLLEACQREVAQHALEGAVTFHGAQPSQKVQECMRAAAVFVQHSVREHDVERMAEAICELLEDPERAGAMGDAGRERVLRHFTIEQTANRLRDILRC